MKLLTRILVLSLSSHLHADSACEDVVKNISAPIFPSTTAAWPVLLRNGACSITLKYDLDQGTPENFQAATEERCVLFERSAIQALKASEFNVDATRVACTYVFIFDIELDNQQK